jgi:hypothetical protein
MTRIAVPLVAVVLGAACSGTPSRVVTIIQDGCVTAAGNQFVLTALQRGEAQPSLQRGTSGGRPNPTTEAYVLVGADEQLRKLVGRRARIAGEADAAEIADLREVSPLVRTRGEDGAVGTTGTTTAIGSGSYLRLQIHRVRVLSANATGDECGSLVARGA